MAVSPTLQQPSKQSVSVCTGSHPCSLVIKDEELEMNHDMVFWGVIICVVGAAAVTGWLFYMLYRNATKDQGKK